MLGATSRFVLFAIALLQTSVLEPLSAQNAREIAAASEAGIGSAEFDGLLAKLPTIVTSDAEGNEHRYYVIEGDISANVQQVYSWVSERTAAPCRVTGTPGELIVLEKDGQKIYWPEGNRALTYTVDRSSFLSEEDYLDVVSSLKQAAKDWEDVCESCGLSFREAKNGAALFKVKFIDSPVDYNAIAFFPDDPDDKRTLFVSSKYFSTSFSKVGVFRHELGHILGYRHTHIVGVPGCNKEDNHWLPLTADEGRDPLSVMHYFCGGGGTREMQISVTDREGHRKLYGLP